jgi:hypothetical protein
MILLNLVNELGLKQANKLMITYVITHKIINLNYSGLRNPDLVIDYLNPSNRHGRIKWGCVYWWNFSHKDQSSSS